MSKCLVTASLAPSALNTSVTSFTSFVKEEHYSETLRVETMRFEKFAALRPPNVCGGKQTQLRQLFMKATDFSNP